MNRKEFKAISDFMSPSVAQKIKEAEDEIDKHFISDRNIKKSDYKIARKIVQKVLLDMVSDFGNRLTKALVDYAEKGYLEMRGRSKNNNLKKTK